MKINVPGYRMVVRSTTRLAVHLRHPPGAIRRTDWPSAGGRPTRTFVRMRGRPDTFGRRLLDVIFPKDVQSDNSNDNDSTVILKVVLCKYKNKLKK
jgi:hypothetical protein